MANESKAAQAASTKKAEPREVSGDRAIRDARPGETKTENVNLVFEGLGNLEDFPEIIDTKDTEGVGTKVVVLSDVVSGADGETYVKGQVLRISKLVPGYGEDQERAKSVIRRLVSLSAIRHATPEEIKQGFAEVTPESENEATQSERSKRLEAEMRNEVLERRIAELEGKGTSTATTTTDDPFGD